MDTRKLTSVFYAIYTVLLCTPTYCLDCYHCTNIQNVSGCHSFTQCNQDEFCYTDTTVAGTERRFTMGCRPIQVCQATAATPIPSLSLIGRDVSNTFGCSQCCNQCCNTDACNKHICVQVDGKWSAWQPWSHCGVTCGKGIKTRERLCNNPAPTNGGEDCPWNGDETDICYLRKCHIKGQWSRWSKWGLCSVSCGVGLERRDRTCSNPYPGPDGDPCLGDYHEDRVCLTRACSVKGQWSRWSEWGLCSVSCGVGLERRDRTCSNPYPGPDDDPCLGDYHEDRVCLTRACSDGHWSSWGSWSSCSLTCNTGLKRRIRTCTNPTPTIGGLQCPGNGEQVNTCNNQDCSITTMTTQTPTIITQSTTTTKATTITQATMPTTKAPTITSRTPSTNTPTTTTASTTKTSTLVATKKTLKPPAYTIPPKTNGQWSSWGGWSSCSATCNTGIKRRTRTCSNPAPTVGGLQCPENSEQFDICYNLDCSITTMTTQTPTTITQSTTTTKATTIVQATTPTTKAPTMTSRTPSTNTPTTTTASTTKTSTVAATTMALKPPAYTIPPNPNGQWSSWGGWSSCSATCNTGIKRRTRTCSNPAPTVGSLQCPENSEQFDICYNLDCPTTCYVCMDDAPDMCDFLYAENTCAPPNNYCINQIINTVNGEKTINRTCGNFDRCYKDWYLGSSDKDVCGTFDDNYIYTLDFECVYCCVEDRCNENMKPPVRTLYNDN